MSKTLIELLSVQFKFFLQQFFVNNLVVFPENYSFTDNL